VERALTLVATGTLTIEMINAAKNEGKMISLPRYLNHSTGKESTRVTGFSDAAWGGATRNFAKSASNLPKAKFDAIIKDARVYMKPVRTRRANAVTEIVPDEDERACIIVSDSETEEECKLSLFSHPSFPDLYNLSESALQCFMYIHKSPLQLCPHFTRSSCLLSC
jgi:hypothetical protein